MPIGDLVRRFPGPGGAAGGVGQLHDGISFAVGCGKGPRDTEKASKNIVGSHQERVSLAMLMNLRDNGQMSVFIDIIPDIA